MGLIGDLLYPDNPDLAREANQDQQKLEKLHTLHNEIVTVYRELAADIRTFDNYLMAVLVLQYHLVYAAEDLEDLADPDVPQVAKSLADKIETAAIDALALKMGYNGVKAIYNRIANVYRESGSYRANLEEGSGELSDEGAANLSEELAPEIDSVASQSEFVASGNVDLLTNTELTTEELSSYAGELGDAAESISTITESSEATEAAGELPDIAEAAESGIEAAGEVTEAAEAAGEAAAEVGVEAGAAATAGAAAVLLPALIIVIVVTEIFSAIEAAETHEKLEKALKHLQKMLSQTEKSLETLKKALKSLLRSGQADIAAYNKVLAKLYQLEKNEQYKRSFAADGFKSFIDQVDALTPETAGSLTGYQKAVSANLTPATDFIRQHAINDGEMVEVIGMIRSKVQKDGADSIDDAYLKSVALVLDTDLNRVKSFDRFRKVLNDIASALAPYHEQIRKQTPEGAKRPARPGSPSFGKMNPKFVPHPNQFQIPRIGSG
ncbi:MAG TPA: hypothetical protein VKA18_05400 [Alphaproteobacteria bacterium]|nr:hypothetical protein [Alphaproteobacteria bacterium]